MIELMKKFLSSAKLDRIALEISERMPLSLKQRLFYGRSFLHWRAFLRESERWDSERVDAYRLEQLRNLLVHSGRNVPYYARLFSDVGFDPRKLQHIGDLKVLPYLEKETVRDRLDEFIDESVPRKFMVEQFTSGTTGIPLRIFQTREWSGIFHAFLYDALERIGYAPADREVQFWNKIRFGKRKELPFFRYGNKLILSNRYLSGQWLSRYVAMIREFKPVFIAGYPSMLSVLAAFLKEKNMPAFDALKAAIVHSETMCAWQRTLLRENISSRLFSVYAMTEPAIFASECEYAASQHVYPQSGLVEFIDTGTGHEEIGVTGFNNYAMPFIRYRTSDLGVEGTEGCNSCGRHHQLIDRIEGRIDEFLINKEGRIISRLLSLVKIFPNTRQYQFFQEEPGRAYLKIVRGERFSESDVSHIRSGLEELLGPMKDTVDIEIVFVDHIPAAPAGKLHLVEQKLDMRAFLGLQ
jgi:phenylacetate-CoA ligase